MILPTAGKIVLLDSHPLGLLTNPKAAPENVGCVAWLERLLAARHQFLVPEITDYELRRELLRANKAAGLKKLDDLKTAVGYLPITTDAMLQAAAFWAQARQTRLQTADNLTLDADMILAAQATTLNPASWLRPGAAVVIATSNVGHLARSAPAQEWSDIA